MNLNDEICKAFDAHAFTYEKAARIQHEIGQRLFERLDYLAQKPRRILDLGCGTGHFLPRLKKKYNDAQVIGVDLSYGMLQQAKNKQKWWSPMGLVKANMSRLPFADASFDLIFANQVLHWSSSLTEVFAELHRVLRVDGCLMFSTLGPDTFSQLRQAWLGVDTYSHTNEFIDMHHVGDALLAAKFLDPVVDMEQLSAHYPSLEQLVRSLKEQGVRHVHAARHPGLMGKQAWRQFSANYAALRTPEGKYPLSYEVVYGHAWKVKALQVSQGNETWISVNELRQNYHQQSKVEDDHGFC
jgi:malonyl-CoA O-methyltransferase